MSKYIVVPVTQGAIDNLAETWDIYRGWVARIWRHPMTEHAERQYLPKTPIVAGRVKYALPDNLCADDHLEFAAKRLRGSRGRSIYGRVLEPLPSAARPWLHLQLCELSEIPRRLGTRALAHAQTEELIEELARRGKPVAERGTAVTEAQIAVLQEALESLSYEPCAASIVSSVADFGKPHCELASCRFCRARKAVAILDELRRPA